jgi:hypothetical protein
VNQAQTREIRRYLRTGQADASGAAWPGRTIVEALGHAREARRAALYTAVRERAETRAIVLPALAEEPHKMVRDRVTPMVRGLFSAREQEAVLALLERSLVVLTPTNVEHVLTDTAWDHTAWALANLYLRSIEAPLLGADAPELAGLSEESTCYLAADAVARRAPLVDVLVHEAAHVFHNCKRRTVGLRETRGREWLLTIEFRKRETFAYACEAYSAILRDARTRVERGHLCTLLATRPGPAEERVDAEELRAIVRDACGARNGWKRILAHCGSQGRGGARDAEVLVEGSSVVETRRRAGSGDVAGATTPGRKVPAVVGDDEVAGS